MSHFRPFRITSRAILVLLLAVASCCAMQAQIPLPLKPGQPGLAPNHRLILKDGAYQIVRKYEIVGDRVRYISVERAGDWEELPVALVDWEATRKWERDLAEAAVHQPSPTMQDAEDLEKEEAAEREELKVRRPVVAEGLALPDVDGVFALDSFEGAPALVELEPVDLAMNAKNRRGLNTLKPLSGARASLELDGAHARVHLHVFAPAIYLALDSLDNAGQLISPPQTVKNGGAEVGSNRKPAAHVPTPGFAIVRADQRKAVRIVGALHVSPSGAVTPEEHVIFTKAEVLPGKFWLKITPQKPLAPGEYALVKILAASEINPSVWDFRIDPQSGDNVGSIGPLK